MLMLTELFVSLGTGNYNSEIRFHSVEILGFLVIHILREVNFGESRNSKTGILLLF